MVKPMENKFKLSWRGRGARGLTETAVWKLQPDWLISDWLGFMEPARGESCPAGQRRGPATPGEDYDPLPDEKHFDISTTPSNWERKRRSPGSIPLRTAWKPQPQNRPTVGVALLSG